MDMRYAGELPVVGTDVALLHYITFAWGTYWFGALLVLCYVSTLLHTPMILPAVASVEEDFNSQTLKTKEYLV